MRITCTWNTENSPETKITFGRGFDKLSRIERLDFLQDCIGELTEKYDETFDSFTK